METNLKPNAINHLDELVKLTNCTVELLAHLTEKDVLSEMDVQQVNSKRIGFEKSLHLYDILKTRTGGRSSLLDALDATKQSGAAKVLREAEAIDEYQSGRFRRFWNIPDFLSTFHGRKDELKQLNDFVNQTYDHGDFNSYLRSSVILVHGTAGTGKTELCKKWAHQFSFSHANTNAVYFCMKDENHINMNLRNVAEAVFGFDYKLETSEEIVCALFEYVRTKQLKWFFLLDDCTDKSLLKLMIPNEAFPVSCSFPYPKIVVVSQISSLDISIVNQVRVGAFKDNEALEYLHGRLEKNKLIISENLCKDICQKLGNHPLAIDNAISYILDRQFSINVDTFLAYIQELDWCPTKRITKTETTYHTTLHLAWNPIIDMVRANYGLQAELVINFFVYVGSFKNCFKLLKSAYTQRKFENICNELASHNLLTYQHEFEMPLVLRMVIRKGLSEDQREFKVLEKILKNLAKVSEPNIGLYYEIWKFACKHKKLVNKYHSTVSINNMRYTPLHVFVEKNDHISVQKLLSHFNRTYFYNSVHKALQRRQFLDVRVHKSQKKVLIELSKHKFRLTEFGESYVMAEVEQSKVESVVYAVLCLIICS